MTDQAIATPMEDHMTDIVGMMERGARMRLDNIPADSSLLSAVFGADVTAEVARRLCAYNEPPISAKDGTSHDVGDEASPLELSMMTIADTMRSDADYRYGWHANLSMMMQDEGVPLDRANDRADSFLKMAFDA